MHMETNKSNWADKIWSLLIGMLIIFLVGGGVIAVVSKEDREKSSSLKPIREYRVDNAQTYYYVNEVEVDGIRYIVLLDGTKAQMMFPKPILTPEKETNSSLSK